MRGHDIEEFYEVIRRHGDWLDQVSPFTNAVDEQQLFLIPFDAEAQVFAPDVGESDGVFSDKVGELVERFSPGEIEASLDFVKSAERDGVEVTISSQGKSVTVGNKTEDNQEEADE